MSYIVDTWWQTEKGGILILPLPYAIPQKPGSATYPLPGIEAIILRSDGTEADINEDGYLCIKKLGLVWQEEYGVILQDLKKFMCLGIIWELRS